MFRSTMTGVAPRAHVVLTGATGFVGKVILRELLDRKEELGIGRISLMVRPSKGRDGKQVEPKARMRSIFAQSQIFTGLPAGWDAHVDVVSCDLGEPNGGVSEEATAELADSVTHILHCAASVEFDLPVAQAAKANVKSALEVLGLAKRFHKLVSMVSVSTAYVQVWRQGPLEERLAPLPRPAREYYQAILDESRTEQEMLGETGHPNTYTFTKCVAEHLLTQERGNVPLTIVRPSVISASWKAPFPGWIDSPAALAGCLLYASLGLVPAFNARPQTRLDVVPVDWVAHRTIEAAFHETPAAPSEPVKIRFAAMGIEKAMRLDRAVDEGRRFFHVRPGPKRVFRMKMAYSPKHHAKLDLYNRTVPTELTKVILPLVGEGRTARRLAKADEKVAYMNGAFSYFTHHQFDFRPTYPYQADGFSPGVYAKLVCRGMYKYLLKKDESALPLAGPDHDDARSDWRWVTEKPHGNAAIRFLGIGLRKVFRRCTEGVTYDRLSFERAMAQVAPGSLLVLAPTHRSYFDFLLTSYLCFQHPELGIPIPDIAAADDFSKIPLVSGLLSRAGAFYIPRGKGKEAPEVSESLRALVKKKGSLMIFVEGQRSRARRMLPPKRGLLRALQATGQTVTILPIAISYDRVPEEGALLRELDGAERAPMNARSILSIGKWLRDLAQKKVSLGRVHIACGEPQTMTPTTEVRALSQTLTSELQKNVVVSRFHLRAFLANAGESLGREVSEEWLAKAIEARGGRVLASKLKAPAYCSPVLERTLRNQWMHWFYADAMRLYPENPVIVDHTARHGWTMTHDVSSDDPRVRRVVDALFAPVLADHALTLRAIATAAAAPFKRFTPKTVVRAFPAAHLPVVEDAFRFLADREVVQTHADGSVANAHADRAEELDGVLRRMTEEAFKREAAYRTGKARPSTTNAAVTGGTSATGSTPNLQAGFTPAGKRDRELDS